MLNSENNFSLPGRNGKSLIAVRRTRLSLQESCCSPPELSLTVLLDVSLKFLIIQTVF